MKKVTLYGSLFSLTAVLVACPQGAPTPEPMPPTAPASISGTVQSWTGGAGAVELLASPYDDKSASNPALSTGTINADGTFSVGLPSASAVTPYLSGLGNTVSIETGCTGGFTSSTVGAQSFGIDLLDIRQNGIYTTSISPASFGDQSTSATVLQSATFKTWVYADRNTTMGGQLNCTSASNGITTTGSITSNAVLVKGWNIVVESLTYQRPVGSNQATLNGTVTTTTDASIAWNTVDLSAASLHTASVGKASLVRNAAAAFARLANR